MNLQRIVATGIGGGAVVVWIATAATSMPSQAVPMPPPDASAVAVDASGAALASEVSRLHERLHPTATPLHSRDLFQYAPRRAAAGRRAATAEAVAAPLNGAPAAAAAPPLKLIGIAEDGAADAVIRTAIVSGMGDVFLVKEGESLASRYRVGAISAAEVELVDTTDESVLRLTLP